MLFDVLARNSAEGSKWSVLLGLLGHRRYKAGHDREPDLPAQGEQALRTKKNRNWNERGLLAAAVALLLALQGCGGGGGRAGDPLVGPSPGSGSSGGGGSGGGSSGSGSEPIKPSSTYAQQCAPGNMLAPAARRTASLGTEKQWLRAYYDEAYLWRDQVPQLNADAAAYSGSDVQQALQAYFDDLRTPQLTASGARRDRFSFMVPEQEWQQEMQAGVAAGYGLRWSMGSPTPPRNLRVAYVEPGSPAALAGLQRGDRLVTVDGVSADANDRTGVDKLNAALYPGASGETHNFVFTTRDGIARSMSLVSAQLNTNAVPMARVLNAADGAKVGYLVFTTHIQTAEQGLIDAVRGFSAAGVSELVLDLRYNGGGYLYLASELAYMIAGAQPTNGRTFEQLRYNARRSTENESTPFYNQSCLPVNGKCSTPQNLPTLNLRRLYVLSQSGTCSASEALINGLRGVDVEVRLVGGRTCGKPYGFSGQENCGNRFLPIEFEGVNAKGFGDYSDGFIPASSQPGTGVPGCQVADDLSRDLGDVREGQLAAALQHRLNGSCPPVSVQSQQARHSALPGLAISEGPQLRNNRFLGVR